jgi:hypothetical protein
MMFAQNDLSYRYEWKREGQSSDAYYGAYSHKERQEKHVCMRSEYLLNFSEASYRTVRGVGNVALIQCVNVTRKICFENLKMLAINLDPYLLT